MPMPRERRPSTAALTRLGAFRTALHCTALHCTALHLDGTSLGAVRYPYSESRVSPPRPEPREAAMIVKNILAGKRGNVVTIEPTADLAAAVKLLAERRIGSVVILGADPGIVCVLS